MQDLNQMAIEASRNEEVLQQLVEQNQMFILKCAAKTSRRYVSKDDDEWSFALAAFIQAVNMYDAGKGSFLPFAELIIQRRLIDFYRSRHKFTKEITVQPSAFDGLIDPEAGDADLQREVAEQSRPSENQKIKDEIAAVSGVFAAYGFSFFDLASCSPKAAKTKRACAQAADCLINNPVVLAEMRRTKLMPIQYIEKQTGLPRKILERHRKYIIAAAEILAGDYPCLAEYMQGLRKELNI